MEAEVLGRRADGGERHGLPSQQIRTEGTHFYSMSHDTASTQRLDTAGISGSRASHVSPPDTFYVRRGKRILDLLMALVLVLVLFPVIALTALATLAAHGTPIIFRQDRIGRGGRTFTMLKFRTMHHDRRTNRHPFSGHDRRRDHKSDADPRHTRVGRFLRMTSLDELPQLWNVIRGEMSLVGPRPEMPSVAERHQLVDHSRHLVRPGLTGAWQVSADRPGYVHQNLHHDMRYLERLSLWTDLTILLRTPFALWRGK